LQEVAIIRGLTKLSCIYCLCILFMVRCKC